jgi:PAS domain S-box-containing protein
MNERLKRRTGRDATGELCYQVLHDLNQKCPWCVNDRVFAGEVVRWEVQSPKDNRWYYCVNSPIQHSDGRLSKQSMIQDITERKRALELVKELQSRYKDLVDNLDDWIWEVDEQGIYTFASPRVSEILGYNPEEVIGKSCFDLVMPEEIDRVSDTFRKAAESRASIVRLVNVRRHKDGHRVVMETSGKPFFDADGKLLGYRGVDRVTVGPDQNRRYT